MKKYLATLLIFALALTGVFAEAVTTTLTLETEIDSVNQIILSPVGDDSETSATGVTYTLPSNFDSINGVEIARLQYITNSAGTVSVTMAGELFKSAGQEHVIPYTLTYDTGQDAKSITPVSGIGGLEGHTVTLFSANYAASLLDVTKSLYLTIGNGSTSFESYPAGSYEATITFTLEAL